MTYSIPEKLRDAIRVGSYVSVPLGRQTVAGYVVGLTSQAPAVKIRAVIGKLVDDEPVGESEVELARWLAERYRCTLADALRCFLPPGVSRKAEHVIDVTDAGRAPEADQAVASAPNQRTALQALRRRETLNIWQLGAVFGGGPQGVAKARGAVSALVGKGLAQETRRLKRPAATARVQQAARLSERDEDWVALADELAARAPRQAEVIAALLDADGDPVLVSDLSRGAVQALNKAGLVEVYEERIERLPEAASLGNEEAQFLTLNPAQQAAVTQVENALVNGKPASFLLHGITGSGKTEVYLHSIRLALDAGRGAIVLVPEISLTPQTVGRFRARFGNRLALLHSSLSVGERFDEWERIRRGDADIVVGARSAIFAPCRRVGVIVVDEEHERAYKQDSEPRYSALDVATERARRENAVLIRGSATPTIEAYYEAKSDESPLSLVNLPDRIDSRPLPPVELVDLRRQPLDGRGGTFSEPLLEALETCIADGEQAILFLNRRGFSTFIMCRECGFSLRCPHCAVALIYHHGTRMLQCHHCGYERTVPESCEDCGGENLVFRGLGTERLADQVERQIEGAVVARMDRDTTARKGAYGTILRRFACGEANVLVGTQMIAKGHDFPNVTLVGVLNADTGLNRPDFRAAEQTFQLLTQVGGRAGRAAKPGRVIVQTYNPDHYAIAAAGRHGFVEFYHRELAARRENRYPPFAKLIKVGFADEDEDAALAVAKRAAECLRHNGVTEEVGALQFLGPAEAPLHKLRGVFRYHMLIKGPDATSVREAVDAMLAGLGDAGTTRVIVDIDPIDMM